MVTPLRDILRSAARTWGIEPAVRLAAVQSAWARVVGPTLAEMSAPVGLRGGRLRVAVTHPTAAQEVRLRGPAIAAALAREIGEGVVTEVATIVRKPFRSAGTRGRRGTGAARRRS
jgi:predicted nucleic acid-binding Zn ribbon protein